MKAGDGRTLHALNRWAQGLGIDCTGAQVSLGPTLYGLWFAQHRPSGALLGYFRARLHYWHGTEQRKAVPHFLGPDDPITQITLLHFPLRVTLIFGRAQIVSKRRVFISIFMDENENMQDQSAPPIYTTNYRLPSTAAPPTSSIVRVGPNPQLHDRRRRVT